MFHQQVIVKKNFKRLLVYKSAYDTAEWQTVFENPETLFQLPDIRYFKNEPRDRSTVAQVTVNNVTVVVKRYNIKYLAHRIKLWFRKSRGMTSWLNIVRLNAMQVPTVEPIAVIEQRFGWLRGRAYFIYHYVAGPAYCDYFSHQKPLTIEAKKTLEDIAHSLHKLRLARIAHRDMHHNNLVTQHQRVLLLDLDNMKKYRVYSSKYAKAHQKDVNKFIHYLGDHEEAKQYFRKVYAQLVEDYKN